MYVILLGPPGTGKGTQAKIAAERLGLAHVATGDLFRENVRQGTELGRQVKAYMDKGDLVPDELTVAMLLDRIAKEDARGGVLLDGFPRTLQQAEALDAALRAEGKEVDLAVHVTASDDEIVRRLGGRWLCRNCGEIYHEESRPPRKAGVCDACGGELYQRDDDKPEVVRERLRLQRPSEALLAYYSGQERLAEVDGEQDVDTVTRELLAAIERGTGAASA
jgi:adenylate kinase